MVRGKSDSSILKSPITTPMNRLISSIVWLAFVALLPPRGLAQPVTYSFVPPAQGGMWDVKADFGAVGDGVTDDTQAFLAAFRGDSAAYETGEHEGGVRTLYIPAGTYLITQPLPVGDKKKLIMGAGRSQTILRLAPHSPAFQDSLNPVAFIDALAKQFQAQNFFIFFKHLTIEVGTGNPGAIGLFYHTNNSGMVFDVTIRAEDRHTGHTGLELRRWPGPGLIKQVTIEGFGYGVRVLDNQYSMTFEDLTIRQARHIGFLNRFNTCSIHQLRIEDCPVGLETRDSPAFLHLIGASFDQGDSVAILHGSGHLTLRDISVTGYPRSLVTGGTTVTSPSLPWWVSHPVKYLFPSVPGPLAPPIAPTPQRAYPAPTDPSVYLVTGTNGPDITAELQNAIDAGYETIYIPGTWGKPGQRSGGWFTSQTVVLRHNLRRLMGLGVVQMDFKPGADQPAFRVANALADTLLIEHLYSNYGSLASIMVEHAQANTLVLQGCGLSYRNTEAGATVFLESVVGDPYHFEGATVYARDLNTESTTQTNVRLTQTDMWTLGHKTERNQIVYDLYQGSRLALDGGLIYNNRTDAPRPMFRLDSTSEGTFSYRNHGTPYIVHVEQARYGEVRKMTSGRTYSQAFPLFSAYLGDAPREPFDLAILSLSHRSVGLGWTDSATTETGFIIERATGSGPWVVIDSTAAEVTSYLDTTVASNTLYTYRVLAYNATNTSLTEYTPTVSASTWPLSVAGPPAAWQVFPNPVSDWLHLRTDMPLGQIRQVCLNDLAGRTLHRWTMPAGSREADYWLGELPAGLYYLQLDGEGGWVSPIRKQ